MALPNKIPTRQEVEDFTDAVSRQPLLRVGQCCQAEQEGCIEESIIAEVGRDLERFFAVTQERVRDETIKDTSMYLHRDARCLQKQ